MKNPDLSGIILMVAVFLLLAYLFAGAPGW